MNFRHNITVRCLSKIIFIGLILLLSVNNVNAYSYATDGYGTFTCSGTAVLHDWYGHLYYQTEFLTYDCDNSIDIYAQWYASFSINPTQYRRTLNTGTDTNTVSQTWYSGIISPGSDHKLQLDKYDGTEPFTYSMTIITSSAYLTEYNINGVVNCVDWIKLYIYANNTYTLFDNKVGNGTYSFKILDTQQYKLVFSDGYEYEFVCDGNKVYDYDGCSQCTINIYDNCANLLNGAFVVVYDKDDNMNVIYSGYNNPINIQGLTKNDELAVIWSTWHGAIYKTCYAQFDHDINLFDPMVYWVMNINVYDNASEPIDGANVDFNQDCVIFGYATRNKYTDSSGLADFYRCENKNALLTVSKNGYQTLSENISGGWYDVHQNTYQVSVILQPSEDSGNNSNSTVYNDTVNDTNATEIPEDIPNADGIPESIQLYFRDVNGAYTTEVKDTDDYVRCYYSVKSSDPLYMTLKFQKSPNGWDWFNVHTYGYYIDNNSYGYMNIPNSYFNDSTLMYRAYIYDDDYYFSDRYAYLSVINETNDSETHYENLTGMCMFMHKQLNNTIDYRENIVCYTLVDANTNALKTVSLELYKEDALIDYKNLTYNDLDADSMYGWYLGYTYEPNYNYSLVLKAEDGSILDTDNIRAINNVGNKLTVKVTDTLGHDLSHAYVFVEHYGSVNTGYQNYGAFEGLPNGESRYKASKSGYRSSAWRSVNMTDENKVVTCSLSLETQPGTSSANPRMSDDDVKNLYYPLMYFLGIVLIMGALINVIK